jgi:protein-tyrosine phosphatase
MSDEVSAGPFRILFVCTGNICRSPFMERLIRVRLETSLRDRRDRIEVSSAGTWGLTGEPMSPDMAELLVEYGADPVGFVARDLTPDDIIAADLVLTASREHRSLVVTDVPRAAGKSATLREFARLLADVTIAEIVSAGADPADQMRAVAQVAFARRGLVPAVDPTDDDIPDPYGGPREGYQLAARLIEEASSVFLALLAV